MIIAIYAGSFDPITNGHMDVLRGGLAIAEKIVLAIGVQPSKTPVFSFDERHKLIIEAAKTMFGAEAARITVVSFDKLLIDKAREVGARIIIRGLRDGTDLDYEMQMAGMNGVMAPELQTVFLPASVGARAITSTLVRQIASMGGDVSAFVPKNIAKALTKKFTTTKKHKA